MAIRCLSLYPRKRAFHLAIILSACVCIVGGALRPSALADLIWRSGLRMRRFLLVLVATFGNNFRNYTVR